LLFSLFSGPEVSVVLTWFRAACLRRTCHRLACVCACKSGLPMVGTWYRDY